MLNEIVKESLSSLSLILVFLMFYLSSILTALKSTIKKDIPEGKIRLEEYKRNLTQFLWLKLIPITFSFIVIFYIFLPTSIHIKEEANFAIWNFNILLTAFIVIEICLFSFCIILISKLVSISKELNKVLKKLR